VFDRRTDCVQQLGFVHGLGKTVQAAQGSNSFHVARLVMPGDNEPSPLHFECYGRDISIEAWQIRILDFGPTSSRVPYRSDYFAGTFAAFMKRKHENLPAQVGFNVSQYLDGSLVCRFLQVVKAPVLRMGADNDHARTFLALRYDVLRPATGDRGKKKSYSNTHRPHGRFSSDRKAILGPSILPGLLRFEPLQLSLLPIYLCLLRLYPALHVFVLFLPSLHLITDQRPAEEAHGSADTGASAGVSGRAANDRAQAGPTKRSNRSAFFPRRQRLRAAEK
jgi:hypothetical protein